MNKFLIFLFLLPLYQWAQISSEKNLNEYPFIETRLVPINRVTGLQKAGSNYLYDTWSNTGKIIYKDKEIKLENINLNLQSNWIEIKISKKNAVAVLIDDHYEILINGRKYRFHSYKKQSAFINEILYESPDIALFRNLYFKLNTLYDIWPEHSGVHGELYLRVSHKKQKLAKLNRRKILKAFSKPEKTEILAIANKNDLSFRTETDLVEILKIYSNL